MGAKSIANNNQRFEECLTTSIGGLIYSDFIASIKHDEHEIRIPLIKNVRYILSPDSIFIKGLLANLPGYIMTDPLLKQWASDYTLNTNAFIDAIYKMTPSIADIIAKKFNVPNAFNEDETIVLQLASDNNQEEFQKYIAHELLLWDISVSSHIYQKDSTNGGKFYMHPYDIVSIDHVSAICPILFDQYMLERMPIVTKLLLFVTGSEYRVNGNNAVFTTTDSNVVKTISTEGAI